MSSLVEIKSKFEREFRRLSIERTSPSLSTFSGFHQLLLDTHCLQPEADVSINYCDPQSSGSAPIVNDESLERALATATPLLRLFLYWRSGHFSTKETAEGYDSEEEEEEEEGRVEEEDNERLEEQLGSDSQCSASTTVCVPPIVSGEAVTAEKEAAVGGGRSGEGDVTGPAVLELPLHPLHTATPRQSQLVAETDHRPVSNGDGSSGDVPTQQLEGLCLSEDSRVVHRRSELEYYSTPTNVDQRPSTEACNDKFDYIIEIYDFRSSLKTKDLLQPFQKEYSQEEFRLKWVDDTHALGIFATSKQAWLAANAPFLKFKTRLLRDGTEQSKMVAVKSAASIKPSGSSVPKPKRTAAVARRMVANALGMRIAVSPEQRQRERQQLKEAKEKKKSAHPN